MWQIVTIWGAFDLASDLEVVFVASDCHQSHGFSQHAKLPRQEIRGKQQVTVNACLCTNLMTADTNYTSLWLS
jgi:hypothetical protein